MTTTRPPELLPNYLTIAQAARLLHRKPWPLYKAIDSGELRASRPGSEGPWLIDPADLRLYVNQHANGSTAGSL